MTVDVDSDHFCIASDNNPIRVSMPYFGVVEQIWELDYNDFRVPVFKCMWVNGNIGVHVDHLGFTLVDLNRVTYMEEPFIMAEQARQVFYIEDTSDSRCKEDQVSSVTKIMIQHLIFVKFLLFPKKCLL